MKKTILSGVLALMMAGSVRASLYIETFTVSGGTIPEGNPVPTPFDGGVSDIPAGGAVLGVTVGLNVSGGYNGDLYAYLVSPNETTVVLLDQPGVNAGNPFGYGGLGLNVTLSDAGSSSIQTTPETDGVVFSGTYSAAGSLANFNGGVADGTWELYFADLASGSGTTTLNSWSLDITAVPEPVNLALGIFLGMAGTGVIAREAMRRILRRHKNARQ